MLNMCRFNKNSLSHDNTSILNVDCSKIATETPFHEISIRKESTELFKRLTRLPIPKQTCRRNYSFVYSTSNLIFLISFLDAPGDVSFHARRTFRICTLSLSKLRNLSSFALWRGRDS
jgi:hypothetical protein